MTAAERLACGAIVAACVILAPAAARADGPAAAPRADALFREGRAALEAKRYDEACPKLAEAQKQEPGAGTLLALALCHEGQGKTATAWHELNEAAALGKKVGRDDLAAAAHKRARAMEPLLSKLVVRVPHIDEVEYEVKRDGEPLEPKQWGKAIPVDPGEHQVDVTATGKVARNYVVRLTGAGTVEIVVDKLEDTPRAAAVAEPSNVEPPRPHTPITEPPAADPARGGPQRTIGLGLVGVGLVGIGVGAYFGGKALSESAEGRRSCAKNPCTEAEKSASQDANDRAKGSFTTSVVSIAAGTGMLALGTIVYMMAPSGPSRATAPRGWMTARVVPAVSPTEASLGVLGTF